MAINEPMGSNRLRAAAGTARRSGTRAAFFWLFALVAGLGTALFIARFLNQRPANVAAPMAKIAVAAIDLPLAGKIRPEDVKLADWPADHLPMGAVRDPKDVIDRILISRVLAGQPVLPGMLAAKNAGNGLAALIPSNMRAMAVRVDDVVGVAGFIHPDDRVDVLVTLRPTRPGGETTSKVFMQNVKVLAVGQEVEANDQARMHANPATVATLLVSPQDSERLALASAEGRLLLTLRSWTDALPVNTGGAVADELIGEPVPAAGQKPADAP
ncbi:MAG TPA: Flp pilus assembly protein CpaB, partial [Polyangia bacterium]|nr:Flp pilus assembly protein CpaB [Polyangia bacterium]